jgi:hypothetical protein
VTNVAPTVPVDNDGATGGSVSEGAANGATVGITATSSDVHGGTVTYSLFDDAGGRFAIDSNGIVTVANASLLNFEDNTSHTITVRASDGTTFTDQTFTIAVTNVAPTVPVDSDGATGGSVSEGAANGATVGITATSSDVHGGTVTYSLFDDAGGRFAIDSNGIVTVANASLLNFEDNTSHTITVRASDGTTFTDQTFTIAVTNVAPAVPADGNAAANTIAEGAANGTVVAGLAIASADVNGGTVTYTLTDNAGGRFAINSATGQVTVANGALIDFETATSHNITVRASDPSGLFTEQTFTVNVADVAPSQPADTNPAANTVAEGAANGTVVAGLAIASTDINGGTVVYSLTDNAGGRFAIDSATGQVTVANGAFINFETAASHNIVVRASDASGSFTEQTFTIQVTDVAPVAGAAESYTTNEDTTLVVPAPGLLGNDSDVNGGTLTAVLGTGPSHAASFTLNADGSFSYTPAANYNGGDSFTYRVSDGTLTSGLVTVTLTVNPVNDAPDLAPNGNLAFYNANSPGAVTVFPNITVTDVDSTTLTGATVVISFGKQTGDILQFTNQNGITGSYNSATGVLTLSGAASLADYQTALRSITFSSTTQQPVGVRTISFVISDGSAQSNLSEPATALMAVIGRIDHHHHGDYGYPGGGGGYGGPPYGGYSDRFITYDPRPFSFPQGFGQGSGIHFVRADAGLTINADRTYEIALPMSSIGAPLAGDIAILSVTLADGSPLPNWLTFDAATGKFAGVLPDGVVASLEPEQGNADVVTGALPPNSAVNGTSTPGSHSERLEVRVVARDSHGNLAIMTFTIVLRPAQQGFNLRSHEGGPVDTARSGDVIVLRPDRIAWALDRDSWSRAADARSAAALVAVVDQGMPAALAGRASLAQQLERSGWRSLSSDRSALLSSLREGAGAWR